MEKLNILSNLKPYELTIKFQSGQFSYIQEGEVKKILTKKTLCEE